MDTTATWKLTPAFAGSGPHIALRDLAKKYGPLMHLQLGEVSTMVVSSSDVAKEVMKTHDMIFASRPHIIATKIVSYDSKNFSFLMVTTGGSCARYFQLNF